MIKKLKTILLTLALSLTSLTPALVPTAVYAANPANNITNNVCTGSYSSSSGTANSGGSGECSQSDLGNGNSIQAIGIKVVKLVSIVVGVISILFIIYGGFRYITSGGDSGKVGNAKNTLIYAVIGLIVVALAQIIVNFVLTSTTSFTDPAS